MDPSGRNMPVLTEKLAELYQFREEKEVEAFLEKHPYLVPLLLEAREQVARYFGPETPVMLKVFYDSEDDEGAELFGLIQSKLSYEEARERLAQFDQGWWLENSSRGDCWLNINLEWT